LAHMALCRIKAVEQLQYQPPGELGKLSAPIFATAQLSYFTPNFCRRSFEIPWFFSPLESES
jgi:hypothetical protein